MAELSFQTKESYADPFNEIEIDVHFEKNGFVWKVPAFWRGGNTWAVRFAPPEPGVFSYKIVCTKELELAGHAGIVEITAYRGDNPLLRHGAFRISENGRYFEHLDGTPFYWLGDTWWSGLSDRLSWEGFQRITADRVKKGFTLIQIVAGLVPYEEYGPCDPGFHNEGGDVWSENFERINPEYFDYADRRIFHLIDNGLVPALVGGWYNLLLIMSPEKMKQHWRYVIARYGAYPVFWVLGGEIYDPPVEVREKIINKTDKLLVEPGLWTDVARYVRETDPYHHPFAAHESHYPLDYPLQDEMLADYDLFQSCHFGWPAAALNVAQINAHYARTQVVKPIVQGEIGYEKLNENHFEDFQRTVFWQAMLNGCAGYTYGNVEVCEFYTTDKPFHRQRWSLRTWEEGMCLPGSYQVGIGARLLRQYEWWRFTPRPDWVSPRGTTLLEPREGFNNYDLGDINDKGWPLGEWSAKDGNFHLPYAAGIPGEVRFVYIPVSAFGIMDYVRPAVNVIPTILKLEEGVPYHAYFWEPSHGIKVDMGLIKRPQPGALLFQGFEGLQTTAENSMLALAPGICERDLVARVKAPASGSIAIVLRYIDAQQYLLAEYNAEKQAICLIERVNGTILPPIAVTSVAGLNGELWLSVEVRGSMAAVSLTGDNNSFTSEIVPIKLPEAGRAGLLCPDGRQSNAEGFELRESPVLEIEKDLERKLYDAEGNYRGELENMPVPPLIYYARQGWGDFGREKHILLDAYRPEKLPMPHDWIFVMESWRTK